MVASSIPMNGNTAVMHSHRLLKFYRRRQTIENFFKETKQSFNSGKMPCQKFRGNEAYLWFVCIAYNISIWFKRDVKEALQMHDEDNSSTSEYISAMRRFF